MLRIIQPLEQLPEKGDIADLPDGGDVEELLLYLETAEELEEKKDIIDQPLNKEYNLTDLGNAERLEQQYGSNTRYVDTQKSFFHYDGIVWNQDTTRLSVYKVHKIVRGIYGEAVHAESETKRRAIAAWAMKCEDSNRVKSVLEQVKGLPSISVNFDIFDSIKTTYLFNCQNGTLNLLTGELQQHKPDNFITRVSPHNFNRNAKKPEVFLKFLNEILEGDIALIEHLQQLIGLALSGDITVQAIWIFYGTGSNGKGALLRIIKHIIGDAYFMDTPISTIMNADKSINNDVARLHSARLVAAQETDEARPLAEGKVKALTGGDPVTARFLHREFFTYTPEYKIILVTNHKPRINGTDHAIWRRVVLVPFNVTIPPERIDPTIEDRMKAEAEGILLWAFEGFQKWQEKGMVIPESISKATGQYRNEEDILGSFISDTCSISEFLTVQSSIIYNRYESWNKKNGEVSKTNKEFSRSMLERGFTKKRSNSGIYYKGIGLNADM